MFCKNCGNELPEGSIFCSRCGYRNDITTDASQSGPNNFSNQEMANGTPSAPTQPEYGQYYQQQPYQQPVYDPNYSQKPPKKRKKVPFIIGGVAAAAVIVGGVCIANASALSNYVKRTFYSPEKYYSYVEANAMNTTCGSLGESYDLYLKQLEEIKAAGNQDVELALRLEDGGRSLLGTVVPADLSWLNEVSLKANGFADDSTLEGTLELYLNQKRLGSFAVAGDWDLQEVYMKVPELSLSYLGTDLSQFESEYDMEFPASGELTQIYTDLATYCPDGKTLDEMLSRYYALFLQNVTSVIKEKQEVTVGNISQKTTVLEAEIMSKDLYKIAHQVLEQLKQDPDVERLIRGFVQQAQALDTYDEVPDADTVYQEFLASIQDAESSLSEEEADGYSTPFLLNKIWVDNSGQIIGRAVTIGESEESMQLFSYLAPTDGKNFELTSSFYGGESTFEVTGKGSTIDDKANGTYTFSADSMPVLTISVADMDTKKAEEGYTSGSMTFHPESGFAQLAEADSETAALLTNYSLKLTFDQSKESSAIDFTLLSVDLPMFTLSLKTSLNGITSSAMPAAEDKVYNIASEEDVMQYLLEADWEGFLANLKNSDIPSEYLDSLESSIMELTEMLEYYSNY